MRLHFSIACYDYRRTSRRRLSINFSRIQVLFADHVHRRSGVYNKFSFLKFKIWWRRQAPFSEGEKNAVSFFSFIFRCFWQPPHCFTGTSLLPFHLFLRPILKFEVTLMRITWANHCLLHKALVIVVLWQILQFRSLGKWVSTLCLPKSSRLWNVGSRDTSWKRTGVRVSMFWNFVIHQIFSEFLQPFRDFRACTTWVGKQRVAPFPLGFLFIRFWIFIGLVNIGSPWSLINHSDTVTGEMSLSVRSSRSRIWIWLTEVMKTSWKKMLSNDSPVLKVSLKLMNRILKTNLTSLETQ